MIPAKKLEEFMKDGTIQIAPLAFMRGRTLSNAFVILDEAQNTTVNQLKMFLTRMGLNAKFIVTGDVTQIDLPRQTQSGLIHALKILGKIKSISIIEFDKRDIVRHRLVRDIVEAYEKKAKAEAKEGNNG
jgi:phosphate starvation-inducible PhoH-like protein